MTSTLATLQAKRAKAKEQGFTLVELAIVLVIIGLIVGGVLVGQDLIKAAEVRSTITQIEQFDSAANTFRNKFNGYPGDISNPSSFPLSSTNAGGNGLGDGDGLLESGSCSDANGLGGENALFWTHLAEADMIPDGTSAMTDYTAVAAIAAVNDTHLPPASIGQGNRFHITTAAGRNHYILSGITATTVTTCAITSSASLPPLTARQIDEKKDDANAETGIVISIADAATITAVGGGSATPASPANGDDCYDTDTDEYATTTDALAEQPACHLRIRTSF